MKQLYNCFVPLGFLPLENSGRFHCGKPAATELRYQIDVACLMFWCFHNPSNSDMDYRLFNVGIWSLCMRMYTGLRFLVYFEGIL